MKQLGPGDPRQIGPYTLLGSLGAGGMGAVYLGRSAGGRTVAVKAVHQELARDDEFRLRFAEEVRAARRVSGVFTAPVVDADTEAAVPWMATSFVVGVPLQQAVADRGPLPEAALRTLTAGVAEALAAVHEAGLVHRDLKPANVLLALDGPRVIDFGIARAVDGTALTSTGSIIGSAPYMSPEQAAGDRLEPSSDVFSLGATIAYAARGSSLFGQGAAAAVLFRVVHTEPDLRAVPESLRALIADCLAKDPDARPTPRRVLARIEEMAQDGPAPSAGWLPEAVAADVVAVRAVMTRLPQPEPEASAEAEAEAETAVLPEHPTKQLPEGAPDPRRRRLITGLAAGGVLAAGAGTWIGLALGGSGPGSGSGDAALRRPSAAKVPDARLGWKATLPSPSPQVLPAEGLVLCPTVEKIIALDDGGATTWSIDAFKDLNINPSVQGPAPKSIAAVHGGRLYVGGSRTRKIDITPGKPVPTDPAAYQPQGVVLAVDIGRGKPAWTAVLDRPHTDTVMFLCGILDGTAYLYGTGDGRDHGDRNQGDYVWGLDLATRKTTAFHGDQNGYVFWAVPESGDRLLLANTTTAVSLTARGAAGWTKHLAADSVAPVGKRFAVIDTRSRLSVLDPATGRALWTQPGILPASLRGGGTATGSGGVLHALRRDRDNRGASVGALDPATGKAHWWTPLPAENPRTAFARLLYGDGNLYRLDARSVVWALDPHTGKPRWKYTGLQGTDPGKLAWSAGDGRLCIADPTTSSVAVLHANGA